MPKQEQKIIICHVSEAFNAGVYEAIVETIKKTPQFHHHILYSSHNNDPLPNIENVLIINVKLTVWQGNKLQKFFHLRRYIKENDIKVLHLHSSWAGVIGRILPIKGISVVYSPHAFAFQRTDINPMIRRFFKLVEQFLQISTDANFAYWPIEYKFFTQMFIQKRTYYNPFLAINRLSNLNYYNKSSKGKILRIITAGRIVPQKDPIFFIETVKYVREQIPVEATWVGMGRKSDSKLFHANDISTVEWTSQKQMQKKYAESDLFLMTSAWESGPITIFEALSCGLPVMLRKIPASEFYGLELSATPQAMALKIIELSSQDLRNTAHLQTQIVLEALNHGPIFDISQMYHDIAN